METTTFSWDPRLFIRDPRLFIRDPRLFSQDPRLFSQDPRLFSRDPRLFIRDPRLFTHDFLPTTHDFLPTTHDFLPTTHDFLPTTHDFLPTTHDFLPTTHDILPTTHDPRLLASPDLSKAFDKVPHNFLLQKLENSGISGSLLSWYKSYLSDRRQRVVLHGVCSDWLPVTSGVPQGSILGPLLFLVYCNDVQDYIQAESSLALFADDSKLYTSLHLPTSCSSLQDNLNNLLKWSVDMKMKFKVMHISRKKLPNKHQYNLDDQSLEQVTNIKDLGITVSSNLSWSKHIEVTAAKANKTLGLIKRICRDINDCATRRLLYCSLVRPKLEYASNV